VWVRIRAGRPLTFPRVENPSPRLAEEVTARLWPCVDLQWQWLGGEAAQSPEDVQLRKAA
jgi:glycerol-3-phosphate dehydrogenase (NAD(P)+)